MAEYKKSKSVWIIYILVAVIVYAIIAFIYLQPQPARAAEIAVGTQSVADSRVAISSVYLDKPGFVVIHKAVGGTLGPVIGNSGLMTGERTGVSVPIDASQAGTRVFAMLHYDNGDGVYTSVDEDTPVILEGNVVVKPIDIIAQASPSPAESPAQAPSCWTCAPEKYAQWIGDATCDAGCGETFVPGDCQSDACTEATPTPSPTPSPTPTPTPTPVPVIGGGGY